MSLLLKRTAWMLAAMSGATALLAESITVYSHRHYEADDALFARFTEETGIEVHVVKAGADELIERMRAEGANSPADVFITADAGRLVRAENAGLLQPVRSSILEERIPAHLRDPEGHWFGFTKRARVIVYAHDRVDADELSTYEALADRRWRGRILMRSSSHIYSQSLLASLIDAMGEKEAEEWARTMRRNLARRPQGSDRDQMRAVAAGLADIAIVNTYYVGLLTRSSDAGDRAAAEAVTIFFPNQENRGTHVNISGAGIAKASDNPAAALRLLEFLVSDEAQSRFPQATNEYPVVESVAWSPLQEAWGQFREDTLDLEILGERNADAVRIFNRTGWE